MKTNQEKTHRKHDINSVYIDFKAILELFKSNYPFTKSEKAEVVAQLEKALAVLKAEIQTID